MGSTNPRSFFILLCLLAARVRPDAQAVEPANYRFEPTDPPTLQQRYTAPQVQLLEKLNRRDVEHLIRLKQIIVPAEWREDELTYSPLPREWAYAQPSPKLIVVHQPSQVFGAYEAGVLVRWGPVSTGRKETPTPAGNFNLNWKSKSRISTDNDQWVLKWYFNFVNSRACGCWSATRCGSTTGAFSGY